LKLDRQRNLLHTQLQHLKKNANILVIGPDNAGKTSLINSLAYMIKKKDGETAWRAAASYDLGKKYKFKVNNFYDF
jgi:ABC-type cobalamin/Fe3+-siderophores transport system ATPase subunit